MTKQDLKRIRIYKERNRILKTLGFNSYKEYLKSDTWAGLRAFVLKNNPNCVACGKPATQVHHTIYTERVLAGKSERGLHPVCGGCHYRAEFRSSDGAKLNPEQATKKLHQSRKRRDRERYKFVESFVDWFTEE